MGSPSCKVCGRFPTCPMLQDEVWDRICVIGGIDKKEFLCFECAEYAGGEIIVTDLNLSPSNYVVRVMVQRALDQGKLRET